VNGESMFRQHMKAIRLMRDGDERQRHYRERTPEERLRTLHWYLAALRGKPSVEPTSPEERLRTLRWYLAALRGKPSVD
jgi:intein/homing endonuclease